MFVLGPTDGFGRARRDQLADVQLDIVGEADLRRGVKVARALGPSLVVVELNVGAPATLAHSSGRPLCFTGSRNSAGCGVPAIPQ